MLNCSYKAKIISNKKVSRNFFILKLESPSGFKKPVPGQFINVRVNEGTLPFFRRPFSIYRADPFLEILYAIVGKGTEFLSHKKKGEILSILGPLGKGFSLPAKGIRQIVFIAGGVGLGPFLIYADKLKEIKANKVLLYGARAGDLIPPLEDFRKNGFKVCLSTEDGSKGKKGRVNVLFDNIDKEEKQSALYTCGPKPMMKAVKDFAVHYDLPAQGSFEEIMACGIGTCLGCAVQTVAGYQTVCEDGPVFNLSDIVF
ncbi:MAG: dihydroorotate dehydrogenase electron transfer subunit [Candidatus Omnitrophica bacterium]|nr:dihydroorotate dehydrogenase electron transfer subunit [Candidatus Omnitrophota bacterium]